MKQLLQLGLELHGFFSHLNLSLLRLLQKNRRKNREAGQEDSSLNADEGGLGRSYALGFNGKGVCRQIRRAVEEAVIRGLKAN
jgi:hypothetical protein